MARGAKKHQWDLFISHASEDKESFVEPVAKALDAFGVSVWYDAFSLRLGDSLSRSIDKGLANSQFGLVVLSPAFFAKKWPEYELRGLTAREMAAGKTILPIWHNVTQSDVVQFSPPLADKMAINSADGTPIEIAVKIIEVVRPDIFTRILRRMAYYQALSKAKKRRISRKTIKPAPIRHKQLSPELTSRIRLIRAALLGAYTHSMAFWKDGFQRDAHPSKEIAVWEQLAAVYHEYSAMNRLSADQQSKVFDVVFAIQAGSPKRNIKSDLSLLPKNAYEVISNMLRYAEPMYDIREEMPFPNVEETPDPQYFDKESMPKDLPEDLIRQLMKENVIADWKNSEQ